MEILNTTPVTILTDSLDDGGEKAIWFIDAHRLCHELGIPYGPLGKRLKDALNKLESNHDKEISLPM